MNVRYLVNDLDNAIQFYAMLGFQVVRKTPSFALIKRGELQMWLSGPGSTAATQLPDGGTPQPGGWNRVILGTRDLEAMLTRLKSKAVKLRSERYDSPAGKHVLVEDPSGNLIEIVEFRRQQQATG